MSGLIGMAEVCRILGCRDRRTARKRLGELGVPVLVLGGRVLLDRDELCRAIRAHARPLEHEGSAAPAGAVLAPGARLWDVHGNQVGPRRMTGRARGDRELALRAAFRAYPAPLVAPATSSTSGSSDDDRRTR